MKNLIAELLVKLAQKEEEAKELTVQVEALEIVVTALLRHMEHDAQQALIQDIEQAIDQDNRNRRNRGTEICQRTAAVSG